LAMGQWVVERWPTVHSNRAPKMGAARNWVLRGHCQADPTGVLFGSTLCSRTRGVLQAEDREGGLGQDVEATGARVDELEVAGGIIRTECSDDQSSGVYGGYKLGCNKGDNAQTDFHWAAAPFRTYPELPIGGDVHCLCWHCSAS
jgi:hypothetical protein